MLKEIRRAVAQSGLTRGGYAVAETPHLLEEALRSRCDIAAVIASETAAGSTEALLGGGVQPLTVVPDAVFRSLAATETPQGVITLVRPPVWSEEDLFGDVPLVLVLDGLQDPGNAGAALRAAEAFGASGAVFLKGSANPFNPKAIRASAGSLFRVPMLAGLEPARLEGMLSVRHVTLYAAVPARGTPAPDTDFRTPCALAIGSEGHGLRPELESIARPVRIPTRAVESLNAAVAAAILLYEAARQRKSL